MIGERTYADAMKRSASDYVTEVLRRAIVTRELEPGERLVEIDMAKKLNVSITPVRHAFMQFCVCVVTVLRRESWYRFLCLCLVNISSAFC